MSLRRLYGLCAVLVLLAGVVLCRTYWVGQQTAYAASAGGQSVQTLALPRARGDFYDLTGRRLTGLSPQYYALCLPGDAPLADRRGGYRICPYEYKNRRTAVKSCAPQYVKKHLLCLIEKGDNQIGRAHV